MQALIQTHFPQWQKFQHQPFQDFLTDLKWRREITQRPLPPQMTCPSEPAVPKAMPKSPPPDILPSQPTPQPTSRTSWISFNPSMVPDQPSPTMLMLMQESDWLDTQVAMLKDGPKP
eukprot:3305748-Amphidinium_carterae.2